MCTVTLIPSATAGHILTSNRDERRSRPTAAPRQMESRDQTQVYPIDGESGGTWIAMNDRGRALCLLNGALEYHEKMPANRMSRGLVLLDLLHDHTTADRFQTIDLHEIEPFTVVSLEFGGRTLLTELRWDGLRKNHRILDPRKTHIWSSATLYSPETKAQREHWFSEWMASESEPLTPEKILNWHRSPHGDDRANDLVMSREELDLSTVSITQITQRKGMLEMDYHDLLLNRTTTNILSLDHEHIA